MTIVKLWNKSKESLMPRSKTKQVRVSPKVPPNNQESISMLSAKSIQSIKNLNNKRTIDEEMKFEVDSIENVYRLYL
jgi:Leucine-rich repeat (LRR) protein